MNSSIENIVQSNIDASKNLVIALSGGVDSSQWTYKFLIPTSVAIATLVIIGNIVQYFRQVTKKRYKVIKK